MPWRLLFLLLTATAAAGEVRFNRDIRPILVSHCTACHGGVKQAGEVSFVYPEQVLPPEGWVIEPGDPEASVLIDRVTETDPDLRMPPPDHGPALSEKEVGLLREWIAQGATWQDHWAFESPATTAPPESAADWPRTDLDRFVYDRLQREGLTPSADAKPERWLRRVSLDLIGLPPSPDELDEFLAAVEVDGEAAYAAAVDRLLASPHFGERWASVWLDQVRYADSKGLGQDTPRNAWKYRDWVIDAFNEDLPFDQFTIKQIAGDLLPAPTAGDLIATTGHRLTQSNEEGGTDDEEFRVAAVLDRVSTTWQVWQGVTFGCVQCHSHPYDPFRHKEYYRFAAFFNNTVDCDLNEEWPTFQAPLDPADNERAVRLDEQIKAIETAIWNQEHGRTSDDLLWRDASIERGWTNRPTKIEVVPEEGRDEFRTAGTVPSNTSIVLELKVPEEARSLTALRVTGMPENLESATADSEWGFVWSEIVLEVAPTVEGEPRAVAIERVVGDEPHPLLDPQESLNSESKWGFGPYTRINHPRSVTLLLAERLMLGPGERLRLTLKHRVSSLGTFPLVARRGRVEWSDSSRLPRLAADPVLADQRRRLAELSAERSKIKSVATPVLAERPEHLRRSQHVFIRGLFLDKADEVQAGTPASFPEIDASGEAPSRLDLARWLVSGENPLTARVTVNRFWARLFGAGLVETEEDFGSSGEAPSHPELLDHLAVRFRGDFAWSVKKLLREIALSSTYRQASAATDEQYERDPRNRLLARGPRHRLSAELVRDQALAASGLLDRKLHGPPVKPPMPAGVWVSFYGGDKWPSTEPGDPTRYRRSVYTYTKRSVPYPMFATFDAPSRDVCTPRRVASNTPLQALAMLNSETMFECAEALADRMRSVGGSPCEQVAYGFRATVSREPTEREAEILLALREQHGGDAGMASVAAALLNLDEFVMK